MNTDEAVQQLESFMSKYNIPDLDRNAMEYLIVKTKDENWHDLKTNPNDLPEIKTDFLSDVVLVIIGDPIDNILAQSRYDYSSNRWMSYTQDVSAWRNIIPFGAWN